MMQLRNTVPSDLTAVEALWRRGFSDTEDELRLFFDKLYPYGSGFCAEEDGKIVSFLCAVPQRAVCEEDEFDLAYLYGITTYPDYRGNGYCRALLAYAEAVLCSMGFVCTVLYPERDALREFYGKRGYSDLLNKTKVIKAPKAAGTADPLDAIGYAGLRETLLCTDDHIQYSLPLLRYQETLSPFYCLQMGLTTGCASAHPEGNTLLVDEILPDASMLPALLSRFSCKTVRYRTPGTEAPFGMCKWLDGRCRTKHLHMGFPFD